MNRGVRRDRDIKERNRFVRRDLVDIVNRVARDLGDVARGVLGAEIDRAVQHELNRRGVRFPGLAVEAVFLRHGVFAERSGNEHISVRGSSHIR